MSTIEIKFRSQTSKKPAIPNQMRVLVPKELWENVGWDTPCMVTLTPLVPATSNAQSGEKHE